MRSVAWAEQRLKALEENMALLKPKVDQRKQESRILLVTSFIAIYGGLGLSAFLGGHYQPIILCGIVLLIWHTIWEFRGINDKVAYDVAKWEYDGLKIGMMLVKGVLQELEINGGEEVGPAGIQDN